MEGVHANPWIAATGIVTLMTAIVARKLLRRVPYMIVAMLVGSAFAYLLAAGGVADVPAVGALSSAPPSLSSPSFALRDWQTLGPAVVALTRWRLPNPSRRPRRGGQVGQRIDANQESSASL
jgi:SulP family sulfate permease